MTLFVRENDFFCAFYSNNYNKILDKYILTVVWEELKYQFSNEHIENVLTSLKPLVKLFKLKMRCVYTL
jgi:hypothetical protein